MPENKIAVMPANNRIMPAPYNAARKTRGGALGYEKAENNPAIPMHFDERGCNLLR
jgi:hypothetical protein